MTKFTEELSSYLVAATGAIGVAGLSRRVALLWGALLLFALGLFSLSSAPWAMSVLLPHSEFHDKMYRVLDPFFLFLVSAWLAFLLLHWPQEGLRTRASFFYYSMFACFLVVFWALLLSGIGHLLKRGVARARPITRIEHSIIAARLDGTLTLEYSSRVSADMFQCPFGRVLFAPGEFQQLPTAEIIQLIVKETGMSNSDASEHLGWIRERVGIGPFDVDMSEKVETLPLISEWRRRMNQSFLLSLFPRTTLCDVNRSAPSGHIFRQAFVLYLAFRLVLFYYKRIPLLQRYRSVRWSYLFLNAAILVWSGWSRVYGYEHTWSDEMLSLVVICALLLVLPAVYLTSQASERHTMSSLGSKQFEHLMRTAKVMLVYFDESEHILLWNPECERVTGWTRQEIQTLDDYIKKLYPGVDHDTLRRRLRRVIDDRVPQKNTVTEITTKSQQKKLILWNATYVTDLTGATAGKLSVGVEVNPLERRLTNIGLVASTLLSELRRDMRDLSNLAEFESERASMPMSKNLKLISEMAQKAYQVCDEFRTHLVGDQWSASHDVSEIIHSACSIVQPVADNSSVSLRQIVPSGPSQVVADSLLLRHALISLLRHAIASTKSRNSEHPTAFSEVGVSVTEERHDRVEYLLISVSWTGGGVESTNVERAGDGAFHQWVPENDTDEGLGLLITYLTAENSGGRLFFEQHPDGRNAIGIRLPKYPGKDHQLLNAE